MLLSDGTSVCSVNDDPSQHDRLPTDRPDALRALRDVLEAGHGPKLGSGATYRRCACAVHERAFALTDAATPAPEADP